MGYKLGESDKALGVAQGVYGDLVHFSGLPDPLEPSLGLPEHLFIYELI